MNQNPHAQVKFTLECVNVLLQEREDWETIRKTISDVNFISRLKGFDVYHIPPRVEQQLKAKLKGNPNFKPAEIKQINFAAKSLCEWVLAVLSFN
jgi:dynein heavy chain